MGNREQSTYRIVRFYADVTDPRHRDIIEKGLSLREAQEHCQDPSNHYRDGDDNLIWFDGYQEDESLEPQPSNPGAERIMDWWQQFEGGNQ